MADKTLKITEEVYNLLLTIKKEEETFDELLKRLVRGNGNLLLRYWGVLGEEEDKKELAQLKKDLEALRNAEKERVEE